MTSSRLFRSLGCLIVSTLFLAIMLDVLSPPGPPDSPEAAYGEALSAARRFVGDAKLSTNPGGAPQVLLLVGDSHPASTLLLSANRSSPRADLRVDQRGRLFSRELVDASASPGQLTVSVQPADRSGKLNECQWRAVCAIASALEEGSPRRAGDVPVRLGQGVAAAYGLSANVEFALSDALTGAKPSK